MDSHTSLAPTYKGIIKKKGLDNMCFWEKQLLKCDIYITTWNCIYTDKGGRKKTQSQQQLRLTCENCVLPKTSLFQFVEKCSRQKMKPCFFHKTCLMSCLQSVLQMYAGSTAWGKEINSTRKIWSLHIWSVFLQNQEWDRGAFTWENICDICFLCRVDVNQSWILNELWI